MTAAAAVCCVLLSVHVTFKLYEYAVALLYNTSTYRYTRLTVGYHINTGTVQYIVE